MLALGIAGLLAGVGCTITIDSHPDHGTTLSWITPRQSDR
jgi:hypothetical protein